jgi:hypothetical protein
MKNVATVLKYPPTWVALVVVLVFEWLVFSWFDPPLVIAIVLVLLGVLSAVAWPITMLATGTLDRLRFRVSAFADLDKQVLAQLERDLRTLADPRGQRQLEELRGKRENLVSILGKRLDSGEITFSRYLASAQSVYSTTLQNLREVAIALQSVSAIDVAYTEQRLAQLDPDDPAAANERSNLESRLALHQSQRTRADELLALNEAALTTLDRTATAMASAPGDARGAASEAAVAELEELAARAAKYHNV